MSQLSLCFPLSWRQIWGKTSCSRRENTAFCILGFQQESLRNTRYINADRTIVFKPDTSPTWKHRIFLPRLLWKHQTNSLPLNVLSNFPHTKSVWQLRQNYFGIDLIDHCSCSKALSKSKGKGIQHDYVNSTYYWLMDIEHKKDVTLPLPPPNVH